jgi:hypothetical protein
MAINPIHLAHRAVCDGYDVHTEHGVLHFDHAASDEEIEAALSSLEAAPPTESVEAEDGVVV